MPAIGRWGLRAFLSMAVGLIAADAFAAKPPPPPPPVCTVSTSAVNFGNYDVFTIPPPSPCYGGTGTITVTCDATSDVLVEIGPSPNSGLIDPRRMRAGVEPLDYSLYSDTTCGSVWGEGASGVSGRAVKNRPEVFTVYGRIPPLQDAGVGFYSETLTVTITY